MKLNVWATGSAVAIVWGILAMLVTGILHAIWPDYGKEFLEAVGSLYPGYDAAPTFRQALTGALYGLVDGFIVGVVFAWAYNYNATRSGKRAS